MPKEQKKDTEEQKKDTEDSKSVAVKRHRNRPDLANFGQENVEPGDNARYLRWARLSLDLPPIDISDEKQVAQRISDYFTACEQNDMKPNMVGMANWLGVDRTTLAGWKRGDFRESTHFNVIRKAISILEAQWIDYMQNGKINPTSGIFLAKNMFQYRDQQDLVVTPNNPMGDEKTAEDIANAYKQLPE